MDAGSGVEAVPPLISSATSTGPSNLKLPVRLSCAVANTPCALVRTPPKVLSFNVILMSTVEDPMPYSRINVFVRASSEEVPGSKVNPAGAALMFENTDALLKSSSPEVSGRRNSNDVENRGMVVAFERCTGPSIVRSTVYGGGGRGVALAWKASARADTLQNRPFMPSSLE
jgi:hypothetical protein